MKPAAADRFAASLAALSPSSDRIGIAVSGGPDSVAMLLLAFAVRPGGIEAATVDHRLRPESSAEAHAVAALCDERGVPHRILVARWPEPPTNNLQAVARDERYGLLGDWALERNLKAVATAHHADDQAETLLMRLSRGSGVGGLGGLRTRRPLVPGVYLIRPLLDWRKAELEQVVTDAGLTAVEDPSNSDVRQDRARMRRWLGENPDLNPARLALSASAIRDANDALEWALAPLVATRLVRQDDAILVAAHDLPREMQRRLLLAAFQALHAQTPRGPDLIRAMASLDAGKTVALGGLKLKPATAGWRISSAPARKESAR